MRAHEGTAAAVGNDVAEADGGVAAADEGRG